MCEGCDAPKVTVVYATDWAGIYVDEKLVSEDGHLELYDLSRELAKHGLVNFQFIDGQDNAVDEQIMENQGLPHLLADLAKPE